MLQIAVAIFPGHPNLIPKPFYPHLEVGIRSKLSQVFKRHAYMQFDFQPEDLFVCDSEGNDVATPPPRLVLLAYCGSRN